MIFRYLIAGGTAAVFDLCFFLLFTTWLGFNYLLIGGLGFLLATSINYLLSIRIVFRSGARFDREREIAAVFLVSGFTLALHELVLFLCVSTFGARGMVGKIIATGAAFLWNYSWRKYYVFREV